MFLTGIVVGLGLHEGDSLKGLLKQGFSKPEKTELGSITKKDNYVHSECVEVERRDPNVFITIHVNSNHTVEDAANALNEVLKDFQEAEILR